MTLDFVLPHWLYWGGLLLFPLFMMAAIRLSARRQSGDTPAGAILEDISSDEPDNPITVAPGNRVTRVLDAVSRFTGLFVAYWTVIAVAVYFYEVVARYFFNSPTNWTHESMFLMFGMQYVLSGAYAYMHDAHVRVDVFYAKASVRGKAMLDIMTSMFFLIFVLALMWTSWTFFISSMNQQDVFFASGYSNEVSFTEWAVAYYPVKGMLFLGSVLLFLQGVSRIIKDIMVFNGRIEPPRRDEGRHA